MKSSTQDKVEGTAKDMAGKVKETAGRATNNPGLQQRGQDEQVEGKVQKKVGDIKKVFDVWSPEAGMGKSPFPPSSFTRWRGRQSGVTST